MKGNKGGDVSASNLNAYILGQTQNAVRLFEYWFGKTPYGRIAITQQPEFNFGQSWPGLVYLPMSAYLDATKRWMMGQSSTSFNAFIQEVTPHEVSHQWWGHIVGWTTFHDQWLSEGIADFSAGLYLQATEKTPEKFYKYLERSRDLVLDKNRFGRSPNDAGPLWMGFRLSTLKDERAYNVVVYMKGGYILHMLRMLMFDPKTGDQAFQAMMQEFVKSHFNKPATTESFQKIVEKYMTPAMDIDKNHRMDWFFRQWVFGTDVPRYKFDYTINPAPNGRFAVRGTIAQSEVGENFCGVVPIYVDLDGRYVMIGRATINGSSVAETSFTLPEKPKRLLINANYDVLARK